MPANNAIALENLSVRYPQGSDVLRNVSFTLPSGSFHFIHGPSGSGKSTLLRLVRMDLFAENGRVLLFGKDVTTCSREERAKLRRRLGLVFQDFRLIPWLSVLDNVALPLRIAGEDESSAQDKAQELLAWVELNGRESALPDTLSGGQRQCVAIARAVIARPDFLLADEPTGCLDSGIAERVLFLLSELQRGGMGILFATHDEALVRRLGHPILRLQSGSIEREVQDAPTQGGQDKAHGTAEVVIAPVATPETQEGAPLQRATG